LWAKHHFRRRTDLPSLVFSFSSIVAILANGVFGSYLLGKGFRPENHDLDTAFISRSPRSPRSLLATSCR
jgi:hypothetical protein